MKNKQLMTKIILITKKNIEDLNPLAIAQTKLTVALTLRISWNSVIRELPISACMLRDPDTERANYDSNTVCY